MEAKKKLLFESQVCSRCSGSGSYSFNLRDGTMCYGCNGNGAKLTKRGAAAQAYFRELCSKPAGELKAGDIIRTTGVTKGCGLFEYRAAVVSIGPADTTGWTSNGEPVTGQIEILTKSEKFGESRMITSPSRVVEVFADRTEARKAALAYQESLTKEGKPRKTREKVAAS